MEEGMKVKTTTVVRVRVYPMLMDAVEGWVRGGYYRAYKHNDSPSEEQMVEEITRYVENGLCEFFDFDGDNNE
jgi:hypothetical protein